MIYNINLRRARSHLVYRATLVDLMFTHSSIKCYMRQGLNAVGHLANKGQHDIIEILSRLLHEYSQAERVS